MRAKQDELVYARVQFDEKYAKETADERYKRLLQRVKEENKKYHVLLINYRDTAISPDEKEAINLHMQVTDGLIQNIEYCWSISKENLIKTQKHVDAEFYLIEALARLECAFHEPDNLTNTKQLQNLISIMPDDNEKYWHDVKSLLYFFLAVAIPLAILLPLGPVPAGVVLSITFVFGLLGSFGCVNERYVGKMLKDAGSVKSDIQSVTDTGSSFFDKAKSAESAHDEEASDVEKDKRRPGHGRTGGFDD